MVAEKTALILDDDADYRQLLEEFLADYDYSVTAYESPLSFLGDIAHCRSHKPCFDIIITDNQMPGMDGIDFLAMLKDISCKVPDGRKVLISGFLTEEIKRKAEELGSRAFKKLTAVTDLTEWLDALPA